MDTINDDDDDNDTISGLVYIQLYEERIKELPGVSEKEKASDLCIEVDVCIQNKNQVIDLNVPLDNSMDEIENELEDILPYDNLEENKRQKDTHYFKNITPDWLFKENKTNVTVEPDIEKEVDDTSKEEDSLNENIENRKIENHNENCPRRKENKNNGENSTENHIIDLEKRMENSGDPYYKDELIRYLYTHVEFLRTELGERDSLIQELLSDSTKRLSVTCFCQTNLTSQSTNEDDVINDASINTSGVFSDHDCESISSQSFIAQYLDPREVPTNLTSPDNEDMDRDILDDCDSLESDTDTITSSFYDSLRSEPVDKIKDITPEDYLNNLRMKFSKTKSKNKKNYNLNSTKDIVVEGITEKRHLRKFNVKLKVSPTADETDVIEFISPLLQHNPKYIILHNGKCNQITHNTVTMTSLRLKHDIETRFPKSQVVFTSTAVRRPEAVNLGKLQTQLEQLEVFHDKAVENRVLSLRVKCKNNCEWTGELRSLEEHIKTCPFDYIHCTNEDCKLPLQRSFLPTHLSEECSFRVLACVFCTENYVSKDAQVHAATCGSLPIDCSNGCGKKDIKRNKMEMHLEICPLSILSCPYADVGCQFKSTKTLRDVHEDAAVKDHLYLAMERIKILEEKAFGARDSLDDSTIEDEKRQLHHQIEEGEYEKYVRKIN